MNPGGGDGTPNLVQEFEDTFQKSLAVLTEEDDLMTRDPETVNNIIEDKIAKFSDLARQLETFFLQKRFVIYNYKPEMVLKEDTTELKSELVKKDELIRKHYDKLLQWQGMLADVQGVQSTNSASRVPPGGAVGGPPGSTGTMTGFPPGGGPPPMPGGLHAPGNFGGFSRMPGPGMYGSGPGGQSLPGPLAYLERTTSNIGGGAPGGPPPSSMGGPGGMSLNGGGGSGGGPPPPGMGPTGSGMMNSMGGGMR